MPISVVAQVGTEVLGEVLNCSEWTCLLPAHTPTRSQDTSPASGLRRPQWL